VEKDVVQLVEKNAELLAEKEQLKEEEEEDVDAEVL
jgi:hypothetical protein